MDPRAYRIAQEFVRAHVRRARYAPEFLQVVESQRFRNPETGNDVRFVSLPDPEQKRIYDAWKTKHNVQEDQPQQRPKQPETREEIDRANLDIARNGRVVGSRLLSEGGASTDEEEKAGRNESYIVKLEHNGQTQIFIRKPAAGEDPNLRFGIDQGTYHQREQSAYDFDRLLGGRGIVPVTHTRGGDDGSYQVWTQGAQLMDDIDELASQLEPEDLLESDDFHRINVMDLILGHQDRHTRNMMWSFDGEPSADNLRLVAIDNGLTLATPQPYYVDMGYAHPFEQFFENDESITGDDEKAQQQEYRRRGDAVVSKALGRVDPKLHEQLQDLDLKDVAKSLTASGLNDKRAVRAALVRLASLQADPRIFQQFLDRQDSLRAAWTDFQLSSGMNDQTLWMAGAGDREEEIDRALEGARPRGGWVTKPSVSDVVQQHRDQLRKADQWGEAAPDEGTKPMADTSSDSTDSTEEEEIDWSKMASNVMELWLRSKVARRGNTLTVSSIDPRSLKKKVVGVFELSRDRKNVREQYKDNRFKRDIQRGIYFAGKRLKPEDGPRFMYALEKMYGARSLYDVKRT